MRNEEGARKGIRHRLECDIVKNKDGARSKLYHDTRCCVG